MQPYYDEVSTLGARVAGNVSYAATEPVFDYMAAAVGLVDRTPPGYRRAASNGVDPSPADLHDFEQSLSDGAVDVLVVNVQTSGAVPDQIRSAAKRAGVPVVEVTEAPPDGSTFEAWQLAQLDALGERGRPAMSDVAVRDVVALDDVSVVRGGRTVWSDGSFRVPEGRGGDRHRPERVREDDPAAAHARPGRAGDRRGLGVGCDSDRGQPAGRVRAAELHRERRRRDPVS